MFAVFLQVASNSISSLAELPVHFRRSSSLPLYSLSPGWSARTLRLLLHRVLFLHDVLSFTMSNCSLRPLYLIQQLDL
jgi:hypothetical protein